MADSSASPGVHVPPPAAPVPAAPHVAALPWEKVQSNGFQALRNSGPWPGKYVVAPGEGDGWQVVMAPVQSGVRDEGVPGLLKSTDPGSHCFSWMAHFPGLPRGSDRCLLSCRVPRGAADPNTAAGGWE